MGQKHQNEVVEILAVGGKLVEYLLGLVLLFVKPFNGHFEDFVVG